MTLLDRRRLLTSGAAAAVFAASGLSASALPKRGGLLRAALSGASRSDGWDARRHTGLFMCGYFCFHQAGLCSGGRHTHVGLPRILAWT